MVTKHIHHMDKALLFHWIQLHLINNTLSWIPIDPEGNRSCNMHTENISKIKIICIIPSLSCLPFYSPSFCLNIILLVASLSILVAHALQFSTAVISVCSYPVTPFLNVQYAWRALPICIQLAQPHILWAASWGFATLNSIAAALFLCFPVCYDLPAMVNSR